MKRREFLTSAMAGGAGLTVPASYGLQNPLTERSLRIAHITDMHIEAGEKIKRAVSALFGQIGNLGDGPDFILNTGDTIMEALNRNRENVHNQWQAWLEYTDGIIPCEMYSCIGNHDVWGWGLNSRLLENDPLYGKAWAASMLKIPDRYYSFQKNGWKFIMLDSTFRNRKGRCYTAKIDSEQMNWLKSELKNTPRTTWICIASHIPILSASVFFDGDNLKNGNWNVPGAWMHTDAPALKDLFNKHPNVKIALSGHTHLADRVSYLGTDYYCNGAVSGKWWLGKYHEFAPAFALVDLFRDGSSSCRLINCEK